MFCVIGGGAPPPAPAPLCPFGPLVPSTKIIKLLITCKADICCPGPVNPSYTAPSVHRSPHAFPGPLHCCAAATALILSNGAMVSAVHGASCAVTAIHRARYALKLCMSLLQFRCGSHATSTMTPFPSGKNTRWTPVKNPSTRARHTGASVRFHMNALPCRNTPAT